MFVRFLIWFSASWLLILPTAALAKDLTAEEKAWLNVVDPIITGEERRTFKKKLRNSRKRSEFVSLFWAKRDPDLSDEINTFRRDYLARYDFVMAHYDRGNKRPQSAKGQIFLLLGKPSRIEMRTDFRLTGLDYKNQFIQFQPELWIYDAPGYEFPRKELRIQFVPISSFGEYTALTDQLSWHYIRNLKYKFLVNRDLKRPPARGSGGQSFQDDIDQASSGQGLTGVTHDSATPHSRPSTGITHAPAPQPSAPPSRPVPIPESPKEMAKTTPPAQRQPEPEPAESSPAPEPTGLVQPETVKQPSPKPDTKPVVVQQPTPLVEVPKPEPSEATVSKPVPKQAPPKTVPVAVPQPTPPVAKPKPEPTKPAPQPDVTPAVIPKPDVPTQPLASNFSPEKGNQANLAAHMTFFGRDANQSLLIGRFGVPMAGLDFRFRDDQYETQFVLFYELTDQQGRIYAQDRITNRMAVPQKSTTEKDNVYYAREITMLVPPGRFTLQAQLETPSGQRLAYEKTQLDVQAFTNTATEITPMVLLDPNVPESQSQVQIGGKPYGIHLSSHLKRGERLYPLIEIAGPLNDDSLNSIEFVVLENGEEVTRWGLYPEETTQATQQSLWVHPVLNTKPLEFGDYVLRFEMDQGNGQWMTRDIPFKVQ